MPTNLFSLSFGNNIHCHHQMLLLPITVTVIKDSDYKTRASSLVLKPETDLVKQKWEFIFCILTVYDWVSISMHVLHAVPDIISRILCHSSGPESKAISWFILGFELIRVIYILYMTFPVRFFLLLLFFFLNHASANKSLQSKSVIIFIVIIICCCCQ